MEILIKNSSMAPIILPGDKILSKKIGFNQLRMNDLVVATNKKNAEISRVVYKNANYFVIKSDNLDSISKKIYRKERVDKIWGIVRKSQ